MWDLVWKKKKKLLNQGSLTVPTTMKYPYWVLIQYYLLSTNHNPGIVFTK